MQHTTSYQSFAGEINQDNLDELLAFHRARFGGWVMEESDGSDDAEDESGSEGEDSQEENEQEQGAEGEDDSSEDDEDESHESSLSLDDAKKALAKVRKENAKLRVGNKGLLEKLEGAKTPEEVEQVIAEAKKDAVDTARSLLVENVALKKGLPEELAELLKGDTREELEAHAEKLAKFAPAQDQDVDPDDLQGGLDGSGDEDKSFDPVKHATKLRAGRYHR